MMSRTKKPQNDVESDSDWDSLPGDVPEPGSSPETKSPSPRAPAHSPAPPKQPYSKHPTKPTNMYKNPLNSIQKSGSATTFEDRSGGLWNNDNNENDGIKVSFSKENNNNVRNNESVKEKKDMSGRAKSPQGQQQNKRPPFTDFRDALSTPIPAAPNPQEQHEMGGVNQAYRLEAGDEVTMNHDSWDESENESQMQQNDVRRSAKHASMKQLKLVTDRRREAKHSPQSLTGYEGGVGTMETSHFSNNQNFENCCLIQVSEGAFDDRNRPSFFHGTKNHFHVKEDDPKPAITDIADKSEVIFQRFWREVFGVLQILLNFFIIFVLELFKTIIFSVRYLLVGILYITGDHFIKPLLSAVFNNIIQPSSVLALNVFTIARNLLNPILALTREILSQVAIPLNAFRLFVWEYKGKEENTCRNVKFV